MSPPNAARRAGPGASQTLSRPPLDAGTPQPGSSQRVKRGDFIPLQTGHVGLYRVSDARLQVGQMAIPRRKAFEQRLIQHQARRRIDGRDGILFVDRLSQHQTPAAITLFQKVVETTGTDDVGQDAFDLATLRDRHLGLRDGAPTVEVDRDATKKVQDAYPLVPALFRHFDEFLKRALEPGRHHDAVGMPYRAE